jgi:hypothetical protein
MALLEVWARSGTADLAKAQNGLLAHGQVYPADQLAPILLPSATPSAPLRTRRVEVLEKPAGSDRDAAAIPRHRNEV